MIFDIFGKHTPYIIASYSVAGAILLIMVGASLWKARSARKALLMLQKI